MRVRTVRQILFLYILVSLGGSANALDLKIGTMLPDGSKYMKNMRDLAKKVARKTRDRVRLEFLPGETVGDDRGVLKKIRSHELDGGMIAATSLSDVLPDCRAYGLPLQFRSFEEVAYVRRRMDESLAEGLRDNGLVTLGVAGGGFAYVMSTEPVRTVDDLRKRKTWAPENERAEAAIREFGLTPVPVPAARVREGLRDGSIEVVIAPPFGAIVQKWHTEIRYLTDVPFLYLSALLVVDRASFETISRTDQETVRELIGAAFEDMDAHSRKVNADALKVLRKRDVEFVSPAGKSLDQWYAWAEAISDRMIDSDRLSRKTRDTLRKHLEDFRSGHSEKSNRRRRR